MLFCVWDSAVGCGFLPGAGVPCNYFPECMLSMLLGYIMVKMIIGGTSLMVQWLRLCTSNTGGMGSIPVWGTKISHAVW